MSSVARAYSRSLSAFPIEPEFTKARAHFVKIPNLEPPRIHAHGELTSIGAHCQREHPGGQQEQWLQGASVIQPGRAIVFHKPAASGIRRVEEAHEVRQCARSLPGGCAPEFHPAARRPDCHFILQRGEFKIGYTGGVRQFCHTFQSGQAVNVECPPSDRCRSQSRPARALATLWSWS